MPAQEKLLKLRSKVVSMISDDCTVSELWPSLGWDQELDDQYLDAKRHGVDLRPLLAPVFSDVISLIADEHYIKVGYTWDQILSGQVPKFSGETPKKSVLNVINYAIRNTMDA